MGLPCMNQKVCGTTDVHPEQAKFFQKVFLCPVCFTVAEKLHLDGLTELQRLLSQWDEAIRVAAVEGRLQFLERSAGDTSKTVLLQTIVQLTEARDARRNRDRSSDAALEPPPQRGDESQVLSPRR